MGFQKAIFVVGPTASGKTALAHALAERFVLLGQRCEVVNIDAFQFYRGVTVGTAKPPADERARFSYHGVDILDPDESMDAARFADFVWQTCAAIRARGHLPICVGGSGLYLRAVLHGLDPLPPRDDHLRALFRASAAAWGWPELHRWLTALAPERAAQLHPNDKTRIERALEIVFQQGAEESGQRLLTRTAPLAEQECLGDAFLIHVDCDDSTLKERIKVRLQAMFRADWLAEVLHLKAAWGEKFQRSQAFKAIGYADLWRWIEQNEPMICSSQNEISLLNDQCESELMERLATLTWQYVRRQRTWNNKERKDWQIDTTCWNSQQFSLPDKIVAFLDKK